MRHTKIGFRFCPGSNWGPYKYFKFFLVWCGGMYSRLWIENHGFESHSGRIALTSNLAQDSFYESKSTSKL